MSINRCKFGLLALRAALAVSGLAAQHAQADCWVDPQVQAQAAEVAQQRFPQVAYRMPEVRVCEARDFAPGIGGRYLGGQHVIELPQWLLPRRELPTTLAHELAHAQVALTGGDSSTAGGHSADWMRLMLQAGYAYEARRIAGIVPGADDALADADDRMALGRQPPLQPPTAHQPPPVVIYRLPRQLCQPLSRVQMWRDARGRVMAQVVVETVCRLVYD